MGDNLLSNFFGMFKDNKIYNKEIFEKEIKVLRDKNKNKISDF